MIRSPARLATTSTQTGRVAPRADRRGHHRGREPRRAAGACPTALFDLIYIDPPFNTGKPQVRRTLEVVPGDERAGFGGRRYASRVLGEQSYDDAFDDYVAFLRPRLEHARRLLAEHGTLYVHLDPREAHYVKVLLDELFGRECFLNEIVWAYDYGARTKRRWPAKHDTILVYVKDPAAYHFDSEAVDREPYMAPGLQTAERVARGKAPTDTWWHTIVPTNGREKTGYPTQKPEGIVRRMVQASSRPGRLVPGLLRGVGDARGGVPAARPPVRPGRPQPRGGADHARAPGRHARRTSVRSGRPTRVGGLTADTQVMRLLPLSRRARAPSPSRRPPTPRS